MRNIITTLVISVMSLSVFGQLPFPQAQISPAQSPSFKPVDKAQLEALKNRQRASTGSRALQPFALDYDAVDEFYTIEDGGAYERFIWDLNTNYDDADTNRFALTWGVVRFDTIIGRDTLGNIVSYPRSSTSVVIDSIEVYVTHENTEGTADTVEISIYQWQGPAGIQVSGPVDAIQNTVLWDTLIITTTSLTAGANSLGILTVFPNLTLNYPANRFSVGVHFYGDTANHTFTVLAGYGDRCGGACFANPSVLDLNSLWRMIAWAGTTDLTGINGLIYNCNQNGTPGEPDECEEFPIQNFVITPYITIDPILSASITPATGATLCPNETVTLSVSPTGGSGSYDIRWTPTLGLSNPFSPTTQATVPATTTYTATIIDQGTPPDTITRSVTITVNAIIIDAGADVNINCGQTTNLVAQVSGVTNGATFAWSNGIFTLNNSNVGAGCYYITATNGVNVGGCSDIDTVCVNVSGVDQVLSFTTTPANSACVGANITFNNTSTRTTGWDWMWNFGDNSGNNIAQSPTYSYDSAGDYTVTLSADSAGCTVGSATRVLDINVCIGIEETWLTNHVEVYPNPTTGLVTLNFRDIDAKSGMIEVYDITGKLAIEEAVSVTGNMQRSLDLSNLSDGVYFVKVQLGDGVVMKKLHVAR